MFDDDKLYFANDPALLLIGSPSTRAHWRCEDRGPDYIKIGRLVAYRGSDLNAWLRSRTIRTRDHRSLDAARDVAAGGPVRDRVGDHKGKSAGR